jgi:DNA-binding IclR family transcriptional regulator
MSPQPSQIKATHTVPVLRKALRVLAAVAQDSGNATTKNLAATLKISPTTCYRILQSFVADGWLRPGAGGTFELSIGLVPLLRPLLRHELLIETVRDPLAQLARTTGLTAKLTVRQGDNAVTLYSAQSPKGTAIVSRVGSSASLAIGSSGATFLAALGDAEVTHLLEGAPEEVWRFQKREDVLRRVRDARRHGCCFDAGSYQPHLHTLSAPMRGPANELMGVITLLGFPQDFHPSVRPALARAVKFTAGGCTQLMTGHAPAASPLAPA